MMTRHRTAAALLCALALLSPMRPGLSAAKEADQKVLGPKLIIAVRERDAKALTALLAQGADPNYRNWLGIPPLMFATAMADEKIVKILLDHKAEADAPSIYGSPLTYAAMNGNPKVTALLLSLGVKVQPNRIDGITPLMIAASQGHTAVAVQLLQKKAAVNASDSEGMNALMHAARSGHLEIVRTLIARRARVNTKDKRGWTALMYASAAGQTPVARFLLAKGANVNAADPQGRTALMLATRYTANPELLRALIAGGARVRAKDKKGRTALSLAAARGSRECVSLLRSKGGGSASVPGASQPNVQRAVKVSLAQIQGSIGEFSKRAQCASCHQQGLGLMVAGMAKEKGLPVNNGLMHAQMEKIYKEMVAGPQPIFKMAVENRDVEVQVPAIDIDDFSIGMGYPLNGLISLGQPSDAALADAVRLVAKQQKPDGRWTYALPRGPMQSSNFSVTALSVRLIHAYAGKEWEGEAAERIARAKAWMLKAPARITEDHAFRLLGLHWAGASNEERQTAIAELKRLQRTDGGWGTAPGQPSDAYSTGQALYALHQSGGLPVSDPAYRRGRTYLLRTQDENGSWFMNKTANPYNTYFDGGYAHGESQYMSFIASCWATMALMQEIPNTPRQSVALHREQLDSRLANGP